MSKEAVDRLRESARNERTCLALNTQLRLTEEQLVESQAENQRLREVLQAAVGAIDYKRQFLYRDMHPDVHAARFDDAFAKIQAALSTPHDNTALRTAPQSG